MCSRRCSLAWALCALALAGAAGCGKKGDPMPPIRMVPAPTQDLVAVQRGERLLLELPYPTTTAAGTPLPAVSEVAVWQLVTPLPAGTAEPPSVDETQFLAGARPVRTVPEDALDEVVRGDRIALELPVPDPADGATLVSLAVKTQGPGGAESALSNRITFLRTESPPPPAALSAEGRADGVRISWEAPEVPPVPAGEMPPEEAPSEDEDEEAAEAAEGGEAAGDGLAGFNVYRRHATERAFGPPIESVGSGARSVVDESAALGERYIYTVTAVASRRPVTVESAFAEAVEVHYRDRFPPPVPREVVALAEEGRVRLAWRESPAPDLAGYRVYRRDPDTQEFRLVTEDLVEDTELVDRGLRSGATYSYRVTAVDASGNESEGSERATAAVR
ncbi:MAG: fibronectin type III domain-containing protein [Thermoanaerobaculia bacterium]